MWNGSFSGWPGVAGVLWLISSVSAWRGRVVLAPDLELGRAGLRVPAHELAEVAARGVGHAAHEVLAGDGLAVEALEVEPHALPGSSPRRSGCGASG